MHKLKLFNKKLAQVKLIHYFCLNKQKVTYGKDKKIQGWLLRLRLGRMGDCYRQQGEGFWAEKNRSS